MRLGWAQLNLLLVYVFGTHWSRHTPDCENFHQIRLSNITLILLADLKKWIQLLLPTMIMAEEKN